MTSLFYLGSKLALICTVLAGSPASICMALASLFILKMHDTVGVAWLGSSYPKAELPQFGCSDHHGG
jgi:hypothetical protein